MVPFFCLFSLPCYAMAWRPAQPGQSPTTIKGTVINSRTKKAISGVLIEVNTLVRKTLSQATTDNLGKYIIESKKLAGFYMLFVYKQGYKPVLYLRYLKQGKTYNSDFKLQPDKQNSPPKINSFKPKNLSTFTTGEPLEITVDASDLDKGYLKYRYIIDNKIVQDWTSSPKYSFTANTQDRGRHKIQVEVKDAKGNTVAKDSDIYIYVSIPQP